MAARNPFASSIPDAFDPYAVLGSRPGRLSTGYYFIRNLLIVGGIAGGLIAAYRNDVIRDLARKVGQEQRYLSAEKFLVGTPGWGTPRSMEPVLAETATAVSAPAAPAATQAEASEPASTSAAVEAPAPARAPEPSPAAAPAPAPEPAAAPVAVAQQAPAVVAPPQAAPPPAAVPPPAPPKPIDPLAPVSFDSLPKVGQPVSQPVSFNSLPAAHAAVAAPVAPRAAAPAPAARPAPAPVVNRSKAKAIRVSLDETPAPGSGRSIPAPRPAAAAPPPEPAAAPALPEYMQKPPPSKVKTTDVHKNDNPLMAAVRGAVRARPPDPKGTVPAAQ